MDFILEVRSKAVLQAHGLFSSLLEFEPYPEFQIAHRSIGSLVLDHAGIAAVDAPARIARVHMVEQVERIHAELRVQPFRQNSERLQERRIRLRPAGAGQRIPNIVAEGTDLRATPGPTRVSIVEQRR